MKILSGIDYHFNGFDTSVLKKFTEFFNFVFNCRFYFVFLVVWKLLFNEKLHWSFVEK